MRSRHAQRNARRRRRARRARKDERKRAIDAVRMLQPSWSDRFIEIGTTTGRTSSLMPNVQNVPRDVVKLHNVRPVGA